MKITVLVSADLRKPRPPLCPWFVDPVPFGRPAPRT